MAGWNFRRRVQIAPGTHLNISKKGISTLIGSKNVSMTLGPNGTYLNTNIPDTGVYKRQKIGKASTSSSPRFKCPFKHVGILYLIIVFFLILIGIISYRDYVDSGTLIFYFSIFSIVITSIIFLFIWALIKFLPWFPSEKSQIKQQVNALPTNADDNKARILRTHFSYLCDKASPQSYYSTLTVTPPEAQVAYANFCEAFIKCLDMSAVWQLAQTISNEGSKGRVATSVAKQLVFWCMADDRPYLLPKPTPAINTIANGPIYFFPQFALHYITNAQYEVWSYEQIKMTIDYVRFQESEHKAPKDSERLDSTWMYVNKDGNPDKRYAYNPLMLVLKYGQVIIETPVGSFTYYTSQYDCVVKLGEAYRKLQTPSDDTIPQISDELDTKDTIIVPTTEHINISRSYFEHITKIVKGLYDFVEKEVNKCTMQKVLDSSHIEIEFNNGVLTDKKEILHTLIWTDMMIGHIWMNHEIDTRKPQTLGVLLYFYMKNCEGHYFPYEKLNIIQDSFHSSITKSIHSITKSLPYKSKKDLTFQSTQIMRKCGEETLEKYKINMYRYFSIATKDNREVSPLEEIFLSSIMRISLEEHKPNDKELSEKQTDNTTSISKHTTEHPMSTLEKLVGLTTVKKEVETLKNLIQIQQLREEKGLKVSPVSYHYVFTGNPGTGKTTVARIIASIYKDMGILKKGHLIETDRAGLVAEYIGQTAVKTNKIIDEALDGVLFIDEAYSLIGQGQDYGKEAIATLLKRMEDDRNRLVVILAGYTNEMKQFIETNPGLQSRFNHYIEFPDYTVDELMQIFTLNIQKYDYVMPEAAYIALKQFFWKTVAHKDKNFGNARFVRNIFEKTLERQANRLASIGNLTSEKLSLIEIEDLPIE